MFDDVFAHAPSVLAAVSVLALLLVSVVACTAFVLFKYRRHISGWCACAGIASMGFGALLAVAGLLTGGPDRVAGLDAGRLLGLFAFLFAMGGGALALRDAFARSAALLGAESEAQLYNRRKSTFLASMSHEIRTPLNAIIGFADALRHGPLAGKPERVQEYAGFIADSGEMLRRLIDDLLDLSRIEAGKYELHLEPLVVVDVARQVTNLMRATADRAGIELRVESDGLNIPVDADRHAVSQILLNLVNNALKFTPRGGSVTVTTETDSAGAAVIAVRDTGEGIPPELLERIFEPFVHGSSETAPGQASFGLGLKICKDLVALHAGEISARSALGSGTCMTVRLPARAVHGVGPCTAGSMSADAASMALKVA